MVDILKNRPNRGCKMRVLVVEDHPMFASVINDEMQSLVAGIEVDVASTLEQALGYVKAKRYDLVLTDLAIPGVRGLSMVRQLRGASSARLAVISANDDSNVVRALHAERCVGFISKGAAPAQFRESLYLLLAGGAVFPDYVYALAPPRSQRQSDSLLTARELDVLMFVALGLQNKEIARELRLGPATIKTHIKNIYTKLGVRSRMAALGKAEELELLSRPHG